MDERDWLTQRFQEHRPRLRALAYRMLGSTSQADDALQEAWIRLSRSNSDEIDNLQAWLLSVVGRVALNMLRSRKRRSEQPLEAHLPDPIVDRAEAAAHQQEEVVEAFLAAARDGDFEALLAVLDPEIVERVDTGSGTIVEVRGAQNVARRAMAAASQRDGLVGRRALINGAAGWVSVLDGKLYAIGALTVHNGRITTMDVLLDPARLARLDLGADYFDS